MHRVSKTLIIAVSAAIFAAGYSTPAGAGFCDTIPFLCTPVGESKSVKSSGSNRATRIAGRYLGGNPTRRKYLWCADFVNLVERKAGRRGTRSRMARSFLTYGRRSSGRPGDIVVFWRGSRNSSSGHVGYLLKKKGSRVLVRGGNQCGRRGARQVCDRWFPTSRVLGYRRP